MLAGRGNRTRNVIQKEAALSRELHLEILSRIEAELGGRTWGWLAQASAIPQSTLSNQINRPRFTLDVLERIAEALGVDLVKLLPPGPVVEGV